MGWRDAAQCSSCALVVYDLDLLFRHLFKLLTKDRPVITIKRDMQPISFLALDNKFSRVSKVVSPRRKLPGLRDHINHQIPGSSLAYLCQRPRDHLLCFVRSCDTSRHTW